MPIAFSASIVRTTPSGNPSIRVTRHRGEAAFEIGDQVGGMLEPDRQADQRIGVGPPHRGANLRRIAGDDEGFHSRPS